MSKQQHRSRPVSFRIPIERWNDIATKADAAGVSVGKWAEERILDALNTPPDPPYTGMWGAEAAMPPERDQTPGEQAYEAEIRARAVRNARLAALQAVDPPTDPFWAPE